MKMLECTAGAVGVSTMRVTAASTRPAAPAAGSQLLLPNARPHSLAGVRLHEVQGPDQGWCASTTDSFDVMGIDATYFPTRLGPPPDDPPVN